MQEIQAGSDSGRPRYVSVCLFVPSLGGARDSVLTRTIELLVKHARVTVVSPLSGEDFQAEITGLGAELFVMPTQQTGMAKAWVYSRAKNALRQFGFMTIAERASVSTPLIEQARLKKQRPFYSALRRGTWRLFGKRQWSIGLLEKTKAWGATTTEARRKEAELNLSSFDVVVCYDLFNPAIEPLISIARKSPVVRIGVLQSWDNLSSKGILPMHFDRLLVWNRQMKEEVTTYYTEYSRSQVTIIGGLMFDVLQKSGTDTRETFHRQLGIEDKNQKLITFLLGFPDIFPSIYEHIRMVEEGLRDKPEMRLVVRTQPGARSAPVSHFLKQFDGRIVTDDAATRAVGSWRAFKRELEWYNILLTHSDLVINYTSTTSIDAARLDKPNVAIAFDLPDQLPYDQSMRRYVDRTHYQWLVELEGIKLCLRPEEFWSSFDAALESPERNAVNRRKVAELGGPLDGLAGHRAAEAILATLDPSLIGAIA